MMRQTMLSAEYLGSRQWAPCDEMGKERCSERFLAERQLLSLEVVNIASSRQFSLEAMQVPDDTCLLSDHHSICMQVSSMPGH